MSRRILANIPVMLRSFVLSLEFGLEATEPRFDPQADRDQDENHPSHDQPREEAPFDGFSASFLKKKFT